MLLANVSNEEGETYTSVVELPYVPSRKIIKPVLHIRPYIHLNIPHPKPRLKILALRRLRNFIVV